MAAKNKKRKLCVYCRSPHNLTRDHSPPKSLFPPPRPKNLTTVLCCRECHQGFNENDEYFRNYLIFASPNKGHGAARQLQESGLRSLQDPNAGELSHPFFGIGNQLWPYKPSMSMAWFSGTEAAADDDRIGAVIERIVVGLFWVENENYLPSDYEAKVTGRYDTAYVDWQVHQLVNRLLNEEEPVNIGNGVFQYWWMWDEQAPSAEAHQSDWLLRFYEGTTFRCRIAKPQGNLYPSPQWASIWPG